MAKAVHVNATSDLRFSEEAKERFFKEWVKRVHRQRADAIEVVTDPKRPKHGSSTECEVFLCTLRAPVGL